MPCLFRKSVSSVKTIGALLLSSDKRSGWDAKRTISKLSAQLEATHTIIREADHSERDNMVLRWCCEREMEEESAIGDSTHPHFNATKT